MGAPRGAQKPDQAPVTPRNSRAPNLSGGTLAIGAAMAPIGLWLNGSFLWSFGRTSEAGVTLAVIGAVTDALTLALLRRPSSGKP